MKQTVEEAAKEARMASAETLTTYGTHTSLDDFTYLSHDEIAEAAFIKGAEWQSRQFPWISVKERLPEQNELVLCRMVSNGAIVSGYIFVEDKKTPRVATQGSFEFEDWNDYECDMWMPIPSFDEILEANKDVLERIKEKGD